MNPRGSNKNPGGPRRFQTPSYELVREWLNKETKRLDNMAVVGDLNKVSQSQIEFVTALNGLLDQQDKLLKYGRIVVKCHENHNFSENVAALRSYLVEELGIEI